MESVIKLMKGIFKNISYTTAPDKNSHIEDLEKYYHSIFYLSLKLLGYNIDSEILTIDGRIDAVIATRDFIYVLEFKMGDAESAMAQIKS